MKASEEVIPRILKADYLGGFKLAYQDDQPQHCVTLALPPTVKSQSLLAFLIHQRDHAHSRERLMDMFWKDYPPRKARRSLSTALWHIRRCFPDQDPLQSNLQSIQFTFEGDVQLDVDVFRIMVNRGTLPDLQNAIALYVGDFLDGFYDDWVVNERYHLQSIFIETLAKLMVLQETVGDLGNALRSAQRLLDLDPLREEAYRLLMRVYCVLGQRNVALEQYRLCRQILRSELDVDPMPETNLLFRNIQSGRYNTRPVASTISTIPTDKVTSASSGRSPLDVAAQEMLVGRKEELAFLDDQWKAVRSGDFKLVLVTGEAGVGKTRLLERFARCLGIQGVRVLWGRCFEFERLLPYQPVTEALRPGLANLMPEDKSSLPEWVFAELSRLFPDILAAKPEHSLQSPTSTDQDQARLFAGLFQFLSMLAASTPLLLVLEDLHWAAESTLELLHYLVRKSSALPILMISSYRPESISGQHPLKEFQRQLQRNGLTISLHLTPLSKEAVEQWVCEMSGRNDMAIPLAQRLYKETEGNPFFLVETIKALFEIGEITLDGGLWKGDSDCIGQRDLPLSASIREVIRARIRRLDGASQDALRVAAVLGNDFDFDLLAAVWNQNEETVLDALDQLLRHQIIVDGSDATDRDYVFKHHKIQEVVYAEISSQRRQYLHGRVGHAMEVLNESQSDDLAGELAFHFWQARKSNKELAEKAVYYLLLAGDRAQRIYAYRDAINYFEQAVSLLKEMADDIRTSDTLMKLGQTYYTVLDFQNSQKAYKEGFTLRQRSKPIQSSVTLPEPPHPLRVDWCGLQQKLPDITLIEGQNWDGVVEQLFSGLVALDEKMNIVPDVAHRWEILAGGQQYIFHLRDDVFWSDGTPVRAIDFVYALRRMLDPSVESPFANLFFDIQGARAIHSGRETNLERLGVQALDSLTLVIELEEPTGHMLHLLAQSAAFPIPHHIWESRGQAWSDVANIVTNGPFRLQSWDPGCQMTLIRNPSYHGSFTGNVNQVELIWCDNERSRLEMYAADELDVLDLGRLSAAEMAQARKQYPDEYVSKSWPSTNYVRFSTELPPFDDIRVRKALAHAIDRNMLAHNVLNGFEFPASGGYIPPGIPGHSAEIGLPHDPEHARLLMHKAGYPGGRAFPQIPLYSDLSFVAHAAFLQEQWQKELGIKIVPEIVTLPELANYLTQDRPFIFIMGWLADYPDPDNFLRLGLQSFATNWHHSNFENLIRQARLIADHEERLALYVQAEKILMNEAPILPLTYWPLHLLVKPWVRRYPTSAGKFWFWKDTILDPH